MCVSVYIKLWEYCTKKKSGTWIIRREHTNPNLDIFLKKNQNKGKKPETVTKQQNKVTVIAESFF